uniref:Uncharacterized protein n=1 Tax=Meloidogyne enterolobii TaxID=390850 RepID=A0A6V7UIK2_MELEN|nr:unnamed protein product [Meloidogyne enterolobii]
MKIVFADSEGIAIHGGWIGNKSGFQILNSNNKNELEKGQRREHALGKPPKYPKGTLNKISFKSFI